MVAAAWMPHAEARYQAMDNTARRRPQLIGLAVVLAGILIVPFVLIRAAANPETTLPPLRSALERMVSPVLWLDRLSGVIGLVSGTTVVQAISAPLGPAIERSVNVAIATTIVGAIVLGWLQLRSAKTSLWLLGGLMVSLAGFHLVAFPHALQPGFERLWIVLAVARDYRELRSSSTLSPSCGQTGHRVLARHCQRDPAGLDRRVLLSTCEDWRRVLAHLSNGVRRAEGRGVCIYRGRQPGQPVKVVAQECVPVLDAAVPGRARVAIQVEPEPDAAIPVELRRLVRSLDRFLHRHEPTTCVSRAAPRPFGADPVFAARIPLAARSSMSLSTSSAPK